MVKFKNLHPHPAHSWLDILRWQFGLLPKESSYCDVRALPKYQPQVDQPAIGETSQPEKIHLTWIGHSSFLIQHRGRNILTDPIFGNCQPIPSPRLRRAAPPGISIETLPTIHDVLVSHCHYDHLDAPTIKRLGNQPHYWLPGALSPWFHQRGIQNCRELKWWESTKLADDLELHCIPAQHFAARTPFDRDRTHWCGWVLQSPSRKIYFAGDTGYCPIFKDLGARFGGFDLAMIPIGAYRPRRIMQPIHTDPFEAVQIHLDVHSRQSVACHWGTFRLTDEPLNEPPIVLQKALAEQNVPAEKFRVLRFGETMVV
jgi:N-acyl-phosphatidylethanolamine-hydrolysing phospholipase D